ncbi:hypothetical protein OKA04_22030 [Luteolibacter flavescens]|uniref:Uncharacterized protein n=1 Tax=Luteolibacter flavescens TaxID=1859460 RepID=A0ABT3FV26_9BACT|nr:hypothetical protein [Luteolibacter flavescens]MCW1887431.1 hypothetical protein [Luteolibacter flavescens]
MTVATPTHSSRRLIVTRAALLAAALTFQSNGESISYNFSETSTNTTQTLDTTTPKGPLGSLVWNDSYVVTTGNVATGTEDGLVDGSGGATGASISWTSKNTWYGDGVYNTQDQRIVLGYLDDGDDGVTVTVTNIPYENYNVYGILASDAGSNTTYTTKDFLINGTTWALGGSAPATATAFASMEASSANGAWVKIIPGTQTGNYWKISNLTSGTLTIDGEPGVNNGNRASLAAIIIEDNTDTDNDGMIDSWEINNNLIVGYDDSQEDADGDGVTNIREFQLGLNPQNPDTDFDGLDDGVELSEAYGTNPLVADTDGDGSPDGEDTAPLDPHIRPGTSTITWTTEGELTSDAAISMTGTLAQAWVFGSAGVDVTIGSTTINFASVSGNTGTFFTANGDTTGNASLDNLLNNHAASEGIAWQYMLTGLTPGATYQVQVIAGADRRAGISTRTQKIGDGVGHFTGNLARSGPGYAIGTFTASAEATQIISVVPGDINPVDPAITAIILREVDLSTLALTSSTFSPTQITLTWISEAGMTYDVEYSDTLTAGSWQNVNASPIPATGLSTSYTFPRPAGTKRFFRVSEN